MTKLVNIHLYLFQVPMILAVLLSPFLLTIEMWIISFIIGYMISMLQMEIGIHRYFSHSSFYTNKIIHNILSFLSTVACAGPIIAWVHIHLHHHTNSDTEKDPHSPDNMGKLKAFFRGWFIFNYNYFSDYSIRCRKDKTLAFFEKYYYTINILYIIILLIIDWRLIFPLYFFPGFLTVLVPSFVNAFLHKNNEAINSSIWIYPLWALVGLWGGANHATHHSRPRSYHYPKYDLSGIIIKYLLRRA